MMVITAILPIFALIALGYGMGLRAWLSQEAAAGLAKLAFSLFMPMLMFTGMAEADLRKGFSAGLLLAYFIPVLLAFVVVNAIAHRQRGHSTPFGMTTAYSNNVLVGIPLVAGVYGDDALVYVFSVLAIHSLILFNLQSFYDTFANKRDVNARGLLKSLFNPLVIGLVLGVLLNLSGLSLPGAVARGTHWLAQAALPCALIALGLNLSKYRLRPSGTAVVLVLVKLFVLPASVLAASWLLGLGPVPTGVLTLMAACPSGVNVLGFAQTAEDNRTVSAAVTLSTLLAIATIPLWIWLAHALV